MTKWLIMLFGLLSSVAALQASVAVYEVEVVSFKRVAQGEYEIKIRKLAEYGRQHVTQRRATQTIHLRHRPDRLSSDRRRQYDKRAFDRAIELLSQQLARSRRVSLGELSGVGYLPICRRARHQYRSDALGIDTIPMTGENVITFVHSDLGNPCSKD